MRDFLIFVLCACLSITLYGKTKDNQKQIIKEQHEKKIPQEAVTIKTKELYLNIFTQEVILLNNKIFSLNKIKIPQVKNIVIRTIRNRGPDKYILVEFKKL